MSEKVGPYRLSRTLGMGTFSKVKMAVHEPTKKKVAIKILNRKKLASLDMGTKIWREINIMKKFNHPHIIRLYEVIDTPSDIYVVMEYSPGGELFDYIVSKGKLSEAEGRKLFQQIISGIEYCHNRLVSHRDLKPENLLLDEMGNVKIADFGLSNTMLDGDFLKTSCGSPNYAAPEVVSGSLYCGSEVDVWSCGVILYALVVGSLPFDEENIPSLFRKIKSGIYSIPSYLSPEAQDIIRRMLVVDPLERITIQEIRKHPFFTADLPYYLSVSAHDLIFESNMLNPEAVELTTKLGYTKDDIVKAVRAGPDLVTVKDFPSSAELRPISVAYNLFLDYVRKTSKKTLAPVELEEKEPIETLLSITPKGMGLKAFKFDVEKWKVGIILGADPATIMKVFFESLKILKLTWKVVSPYRIKVRYIVPQGYRLNTIPIHSIVIKGNFQLFRGKGKGEYVIDAQRISGHPYYFMELCAMLISQFETIFTAP